MDSELLLARVRELRAKGCSPKEIARALGVPPAKVSPLVRAIAQQEHSGCERVECWINAGWSGGLTFDANRGWPDDPDAASTGSGLVNVLVGRERAPGKVVVCGYLVDVYCLGVKDVLGPRGVASHAMPEFVRRYFNVHDDPPLRAPLDLAQHIVRPL